MKIFPFEKQGRSIFLSGSWWTAAPKFKFKGSDRYQTPYIVEEDVSTRTISRHLRVLE